MPRIGATDDEELPPAKKPKIGLCQRILDRARIGTTDDEGYSPDEDIWTDDEELPPAEEYELPPDEVAKEPLTDLDKMLLEHLGQKGLRFRD